MKNILIKYSTLLTLVTTGFAYSATVSELQNKEKEVYTILSEYWIDKAGDVHVGNKDSKELQFAFSESLMPRLTIKQIIDSMTTAISKFEKSKQEAFASAVQPYLNELTNARTELQTERKKMDDAAAMLAPLLGKTVQDILKLPDSNIAALISTKITDGSKKLDAHTAATNLKKLRPQFNVQTMDQPMPGQKTAGVSGDAEKTKTSSSGKTAAAAEAVAKSSFNLSEMAGFVGESAMYSMCRDRHFDIILDEKGLNFITEAR